MATCAHQQQLARARVGATTTSAHTTRRLALRVRASGSSSEPRPPPRTQSAPGAVRPAPPAAGAVRRPPQPPVMLGPDGKPLEVRVYFLGGRGWERGGGGRRRAAMTTERRGKKSVLCWTPRLRGSSTKTHLLPRRAVVRPTMPLSLPFTCFLDAWAGDGAARARRVFHQLSRCQQRRNLEDASFAAAALSSDPIMPPFFSPGVRTAAATAQRSKEGSSSRTGKRHGLEDPSFTCAAPRPA